jgi:exopolyphosphatase/pppGpp-phosphohydrolase
MSPLDLPPQKNLEAEFAAVARAMGRDAHAPSDWTLLTLGDEQLCVQRSGAGGLDAAQWIGIGPAHIAHRYFQHDPPRPQDIERAIDLVEDEIMRLGQPEQTGTTLWSASPALLPWSKVAGPHMNIETVEAWFQRLASASLGQPGAMAGLPEGRTATAVLLVLREFMHHRGHADIRVVDGA